MTDYIFLLCSEPSIKSIRVYEDTVPFDLLMLITLEETAHPRHLVLNPSSDCLYVANPSCIWKITTEGQVIKWICRPNLTSIMGVTVATDGEVVVLQRNKTYLEQFFEIFTSDAIFIRRIYLPNYVWTRYAILKPDGQLIIVHETRDDVSVFYSISLAANNGQIIHVGLINLTSEGYFPNRRNRTPLCWSIDLEVAHVNSYDVASISECFAVEADSFLMLEENIFSLDNLWRTSAINKIILLDAQVEFGIHSSKNSVVMYT